MRQQLLDLQRELALALHTEQKAEQAAKELQAEYDAKLAAFEAQQKPLVESCNAAAKRHTDAKQCVKDLRDKAKDLLGDKFIDGGLPDGFIQKRTTEVTYDEQGLFKIAVDRFPFLLKLDEKAVHKFFTDWAIEDKKTKTLSLPEHIRCWASVDVRYIPQVNISNATLLKLELGDVEDSPQDEKPEAAEAQAEKYLEQFAQENDIDPEQPIDIDSEFTVPANLEDIKC